MSGHDFKQLNDKEFEALCADILGNVQGCRIERFKPGRDCGVDGRFFSSPEHEVILQCKHWCNTPTSKLIRELRNNEKPKLAKLKPKRYLLAVSNPLSRTDKQEIFEIFFPFITSESDIYGMEDLNDLLIRFPQVERRHYKLWIKSASVLSHIFSNALLGRSKHSLQEIYHESKLYAITSNHESALNILEKFGVLILSGDPGVGKTTLANQLCLKYAAEGFDYFKIDHEIKEAEDVFDEDSKQIFYFDDFLGRNYLLALRGHEGNQVTQFIRRISLNKNKRFVLTSRSTILNQGKLLIDNFEHSNLKRNEFELRIRSLSDFDKAKILYNHIVHSGIGSEYVDQLYIDKRYKKVISHKHFNPRLISFITDPSRLENCSADHYWTYVVNSLDDPSQIWDNPFSAQLDDFGRLLVQLVVFNGHSLSEGLLAEAYQRYVSLPSSQNLSGRRDYNNTLRLLTGSFLTRTVSSYGAVEVDLFNPSIGDYILKRYSNDLASIQAAMLCLRTTISLNTLMNFKCEGYLSSLQTNHICRELLVNICTTGIDSIAMPYISKLLHTYIQLDCYNHNDLKKINTLLIRIMETDFVEVNYDTYAVLGWALGRGFVTPTDTALFIQLHYCSAVDDDEIRGISDILIKLNEISAEYAHLTDTFSDYVIQLVSENFSEYFDTSEALSKVKLGDQERAYQEVEWLIEERLNDFGIQYVQSDISNIVSCYDVEYYLEKYHRDWYVDNDRIFYGPKDQFIDSIDDLFERG